MVQIESVDRAVAQPEIVSLPATADPAVTAFSAYQQAWRRWSDAQAQLDALIALLPEDIRCGPRVVVGRGGPPGGPFEPIYAHSEAEIERSPWEWLRCDPALRTRKLAAFQLDKIRVEAARRRAGIVDREEQVNSLWIDLEDAEEAMARVTATSLAGLLGQLHVLNENLGHDEGLDRRLCERLTAALRQMSHRAAAVVGNGRG